ncbi:MAG: TonB-dependent receptor, partial [Prevotella sp.]|nr:TonB-dependent receptor [Prevotella sp.]
MTRRKLITTLLVALLSGSAAFGQIHQMERRDTSVVDRSYNLNPVVVTGSGHHQRLKSTATPVHVLSSQEIREQGITTFDQAL